MVFDSMRLLERPEHADEARLLGQLIALASLLTNKYTCEAVRLRGDLCRCRAATHGIDRVLAIAGTWVAGAWVAMLGRGTPAPGTLAHSVLQTAPDGGGWWTPRFAALAYQLLKKDQIDNKLGNLFVCYFASMVVGHTSQHTIAHTHARAHYAHKGVHACTWACDHVRECTYVRTKAR
jgi:hypothetical protein